LDFLLYLQLVMLALNLLFREDVMPPIRIVDGQSQAYESVQPVLPASPAFSAVLVSEMGAPSVHVSPKERKKASAPALKVTLNCYGSVQGVRIDEAGIRNREPNEVKKSVLCPDCDRLVILSFSHGNRGPSVAEQEVIRLGSY
jgi:hypothetical protein